ncbi:MAG: hypothetical protein LBU32_04145 [Clostridiales bacterium]|nr:hypothetical protein [Clostridiales bacterium]
MKPCSIQKGCNCGGRENRYCYYSLMQTTTVNLVRVLTEIGVPLNN